MRRGKHEAEIRSFETFLRSRELRMTAQRRDILEAVLEHDGHFTAEGLRNLLVREGGAVSTATVYRGLHLLEEAGIVEAHDFADGQRRYERLLEREHHDHMICVDCRAVIEFHSKEIERIQKRAAQRKGFELHGHSLTLFVKCKALRETGKCARRDAQEKKNRRRRRR